MTTLGVAVFELAIPADGFDAHFPVTKDTARTPPLHVWVPSCEAPLLLSPCPPGGSPLTHSSSSYPDPQPNEAQTPQAAVSGAGAPPWGTQAAAQQAPACWVSSARSSPGSRPSSWLWCLCFITMGLRQTPQQRRHPPWEDRQDPDRMQGLFQVLPLPWLLLAA